MYYRSCGYLQIKKSSLHHRCVEWWYSRAKICRLRSLGHGLWLKQGARLGTCIELYALMGKRFVVTATTDRNSLDGDHKYIQVHATEPLQRDDRLQPFPPGTSSTTQKDGSVLPLKRHQLIEGNMP